MKLLFWDKLTAQEKDQVLERPSSTNNETCRAQTAEIILKVKEQGDEALRALTAQFDKVMVDELRVTKDEFRFAKTQVDTQDLEAIRFAIKRIGDYAKAQITENTYFYQDGVVCEVLSRPIESVGLYVPGGSAALVSTVLMLGVPAGIAGCRTRIICTPPGKDGKINPNILVAALECGIQEVYKVGGAQAIAAMAYGTQTLPKVNKIFGPGNRWVTQAKMLCSQDEKGASIDMPAGPSEILVIADKTASPSFIAADLLSQAEHDSASQVIFISLSQEQVEKVQAQLKVQLTALPRQEIAKQALSQSAAIVVNDLETAIAISNQYGPEHLSLQVDSPRQYLSLIQNAGTVFLGHWTPETLGDYVTGANHVLPTSGFTKMWSGLSVLDFMKRVGVQEASLQGLKKLGPYAQRLAMLEALKAHENAVTIRLKEMIS